MSENPATFVDIFSEEVFGHECASHCSPKWKGRLSEILKNDPLGIALVGGMLVPYGEDFHWQSLAEVWRAYGVRVIAHLRIKREPVIVDMVHVRNLAEFQNACASIYALRSLAEVLSVGQPEGAVLLAKHDNYADQMIVVYGARYMARTLGTIVRGWPTLNSDMGLASDGMVPVAHVKFAAAAVSPTDEELQAHFGLATTSSVIEVKALIVAAVACPKCGATEGSLCHSKRGRSAVPVHNSRAEWARQWENKRWWWPKYLAWQESLIAYNEARDRRDGRA